LKKKKGKERGMQKRLGQKRGGGGRDSARRGVGSSGEKGWRDSRQFFSRCNGREEKKSKSLGGGERGVRENDLTPMCSPRKKKEAWQQGAARERTFPLRGMGGRLKHANLEGKSRMVETGEAT